MASVSYSQLRGNKLTSDSDIESCDPVVYNEDLKKDIKSVNGTDLDPKGVAHPCGIAARSLFSESFTLAAPGGADIPINAKGIAWEDDVTYR